MCDRNGAKQRAADDIMAFQAIPCPHAEQGAKNTDILRQRFVLTEKVELHQVHIDGHKHHIAQPFRQADVEAPPEVLRVLCKQRHIEVCRNIQPE